MSLHALANHMATKGRNGDSMLVHMTPGEVAGLHALALKHGGELTTNPDTGLPEASFLKSLLPMLAGAALNFFVPGLGAAVGGAFGVGAAAGTGIAVGGITGLATGSLSRGLMAGLGAYGGAGLTEGLMGAGAQELAATGTPLAENLVGGLDAAGNAVSVPPIEQINPSNFAMSNADKLSTGVQGLGTEAGRASALANMGGTSGALKYAGAAASPIMADLMTPTVTKMPDISSNADIRQAIYDPYSGTYRRLNPVPAKNYGTPAWSPYKSAAAGGIVALAAGGMPGYAGGGDLSNIYKNLGGKDVYDKITADYLKAGGTEAGLPSIFSAYDKPVAAPAAVAAPVVAAPAAPNLNNIYANLGGKQVYDKIASDYIKAGGTEAGLPSILSQYDKPVATATAAPVVTAAATKPALTTAQQQALDLMLQSSIGGVNTSAMDALGGAAAVKKLAESAGYTGSATQLYDYANTHPGSIDWTSDAGKQLSMNNYIGTYTNDLAKKFKTPAEQALELMYRSTTGGVPTAALDALGGSAAVKSLARSAGFSETPEWQQEYERKMGYTVIPRMSTADSIAADKAASSKAAADAAATKIGSQVTSNGIVDLQTDTGVKQDKTDTTTTGINQLATTKPADIKSTITTDGTYTGTSGTAPTMGTLFGQGKFVGTGTEMGTGTTGPIVDYGGKTAFGDTSPLTFAQKQIAEKSAAKNAADKAKLDLYRQWGTLNPKATNLEHANFVDTIGLDPAVAAQLIGISADQAQSAYNDAKYNKQTGDSLAAYRYLMGQGAYPTKSGVGEIMRPYSEATLGIPANTNKKYVFDQATGKYNLNPDYVAEYKDPSGGTNYLMSQKEILNYFKANAGQDDATTYAWAVENNLTPQEISQATGVPISQIAPKWRAAVAKSAAAKDTKTVAAGPNTVAVGGTNYDLTKQDSQPPEDNNGPWTWDAAEKKWVQYGKFAMGGMTGYAVGGGLGSLGSYSDGGRLLRGPGDGVSDSIPATIGRKQQPARLADGEFVVPARIVSELGNGSTDAGAKKLYAMMDRVQRARGKTTGKNKVAANSRADKYLPA